MSSVMLMFECPQPLLHHLRVHAFQEEERRRRVAQRMEGDSGQAGAAEDALELAEDVALRERLTLVGAEDEVAMLPLEPTEPLLVLLALVLRGARRARRAGRSCAAPSRSSARRRCHRAPTGAARAPRRARGRCRPISGRAVRRSASRSPAPSPPAPPSGRRARRGGGYEPPRVTSTSISVRGRRGGCTSVATLRGQRFQSTACSSAPTQRAWTLRTVFGESPCPRSAGVELLDVRRLQLGHLQPPSDGSDVEPRQVAVVLARAGLTECATTSASHRSTCRRGSAARPGAEPVIGVGEAVARRLLLTPRGSSCPSR